MVDEVSENLDIYEGYILKGMKMHPLNEQEGSKIILNGLIFMNKYRGQEMTITTFHKHKLKNYEIIISNDLT